MLCNVYRLAFLALPAYFEVDAHKPRDPTKGKMSFHEEGTLDEYHSPSPSNEQVHEDHEDLHGHYLGDGHDHSGDSFLQEHGAEEGQRRTPASRVHKHVEEGAHEDVDPHAAHHHEEGHAHQHGGHEQGGHDDHHGHHDHSHDAAAPGQQDAWSEAGSFLENNKNPGFLQGGERAMNGGSSSDGFLAGDENKTQARKTTWEPVGNRQRNFLLA